MRNFCVMYRAEMKKVLTKKSFWIALGVGLLIVLLVGLTNLSSEGHIRYVGNERVVLSKSAGARVDDTFLKAFQNEVQQELSAHPEKYEKLMAYDPGTGFMNGSDAIGKKTLYDFLYNVVRDKELVPTVSEKVFYEKMRENIEQDGLGLGCTTNEVNTWLKQYDSIEKPISYRYAQGYSNILDVLFLVGWVLYLNIAVALSGVFADEKSHKTDAIILSARKGRNMICVAKLLAGISVALLQALFILGGCFGVMLAFFGAEGASGQIQNIIPSSPWPITISQMIWIYLALAVMTTILFSLTNMLLSHVTHSAVATMAVHTAVLFAGLFNVPGKIGWLAKVWQLRPTMALYYGTFCNTYLYGRLNNVEISFLIYGACIVLLAMGQTILYKKAQVESR